MAENYSTDGAICPYCGHIDRASDSDGLLYNEEMMMTDAPERIWVDPGAWEIVGAKTKIEPHYDVQYIRADIHAAALAENEALRAALKPFADAWQITLASTERMTGLSLGQFGALAAHQVSGVHFQRAALALAPERKEGV